MRKALRSEPDSLTPLVNYGALLYRAGRFEEALDPLKKSDELVRAAKKKSSPWTCFFLAMCHDRLGQKEEAARYLTAALDGMEAVLDPNSDSGSPPLSYQKRVSLRLLFEESKQMAAFATISEQQAARLAARLESARPKIAPDYYEQAQAYAETGYLDETIGNHSEAIQAAPDVDTKRETEKTRQD